LCLELLQELDPASIVDVGCGSGVLSIAAAKLGFGPVIGVDVDPAAVEATLANAGANAVDVAAHAADALADDLPVAALVVANVSLEVVEALAARLDARLLVASGYLERDEPHLRGWLRRERRSYDGWTAHLLERA
jgi:ribosomal protein L11 methyltransferase